MSVKQKSSNMRAITVQFVGKLFVIQKSQLGRESMSVNQTVLDLLNTAKTCNRCGLTKAISEYRKRNRSILNTCKKCNGRVSHYDAEYAKTITKKVCRWCKQEKLIDLFPSSKRERDGRLTHCNSCHYQRYNRIRHQNFVTVLDQVCRKCGMEKRALDFVKCSHNISGLRRTCKDCENLSRQEQRRRAFEDDKMRAIAQGLFLGMRARAKKKGIPLEIDAQFIQEKLLTIKQCQCCHIDFDYSNRRVNTRANGVSMDRLVPSKGYTRENLRLLCWRCNNLKRDAMAAELRRIADWLDKELAQEPAKMEPDSGHMSNKDYDTRMMETGK